MSRLALALGISLLAVTAVAPVANAGPRTKLVSQDSIGNAADDDSNSPAASANGKVAFFRSEARLQSPPDVDDNTSIYFHGFGGGNTRLISKSKAGINADANAHWPNASANGRYVVFTSTATNLIPGKTLSGASAIFRHDRVTKKLKLVSVNDSGKQASASCWDSDISASGKLVVFECSGSATNMTGKNIHGKDQIYLRNVATGKTKLISKNKAGKAADGDAAKAAISADGRYVVFEAAAANLPGKNPGTIRQIYLRDWKAGKISLVSKNRFGKAGNDISNDATVSNGAKVIAFTSRATNLGANDTNAVADVYRHRRFVGPRGKTDRASKTWRGRQLNESASGAHLSKDGRYLVYRSSATNAVKGGFASAIDQIYRRDLDKGKLILVSRTSGRIGNDDSFDPYISKDGRHVFFASRATNLVPGGDTNGPDADVLRRGPY